VKPIAVILHFTDEEIRLVDDYSMERVAWAVLTNIFKLSLKERDRAPGSRQAGPSVSLTVAEIRMGKRNDGNSAGEKSEGGGNEAEIVGIADGVMRVWELRFDLLKPIVLTFSKSLFELSGDWRWSWREPK